jgi:hypothetical protein
MRKYLVSNSIAIGYNAIDLFFRFKILWSI